MVGKTNYKPLHIDLDLWIPGNIIYSNDNALNTVNSQSGITSTIAGVTDSDEYSNGYGGDARFDRVKGFIQIT